MCIATLAIASAGLAAGGKVLGGIAQGNAASYQAQVARNNAVVAQQNAAYAASAGASQTEAAGLRARSQAAGARASMAANGIDVNSGSAIDVQTGNRELGELDAATVASNAAWDAYGYSAQSTNFTAQANIDQREAAFDPIEGAIEGASSFLGNSSVQSALFPQISTSQTPITAGPIQGLTSGNGLATGLSQSLPDASLLSGDPELPEGYEWMRSTAV